jgi:protein phosphatase
LRNNQLSQITHDDTYVQYLVDSGKITPDEAKDHPRKSVILRALLGTDVEPDVSIREARAGDRYLLCSDGLSDVVTPDTIAETLRLPDPQDAADKLVELALRGGGPDNITVIVADVINARIGDRLDDAPIVAGAFVDPASADVPSPDGSPAQKARALTPRPAPKEEPDGKRARKRRGWRPWAVVIGILVLIVAALGGTYAWAQTQYFVWRADGDVAIYQGVNAQFGPLKFFNVYKVTNLRLADLQPTFRNQVVNGITANSKSDAEQIVRNLNSNLKPLCPASHPTPTPTPATSSPTATPRSSSHTSSHSGTRHSSRTSTRRPAAGRSGTTHRSTAHATSRHSAAAASRTPQPSSLPSTSAAAPTPTLRPPNCRPR